MTSAPTVTPFVPSDNIARMQESATIAVSQKARALKAQGRAIIDLGAGEPDFDTPAFIRRAAQLAIDNGATHYTAVEGIPPLREAIARQARDQWKGPDAVAASEVVVSTGSKQSLFNACFCLFGPGDEVLVPVPSWTSYFEMVSLARATVIPVPGDPTRGFKVTAEDLARHATPRTRGVMLNSPSNPTGAVYTADELGDVVALATEREWWTISDEIYRRISYDGPAASAFDVATSRDRLVVVNGVAKAYAMTGWRVGWTISNEPLARAMTAFQSHTTSNTATVSQHAALAALSNRDEADREIDVMVSQFRIRRDAAMAIAREEPRMQVIDPHGAFYLYLRAPNAERDPQAGVRFASRLIDEASVAVVPGSAFGTPEWVRVSYAAEQSQVEEAMRRIVALYRAGA